MKVTLSWSGRGWGKWIDTLLLALAAANALNFWWVSGDCIGIAPPWYCEWKWSAAPGLVFLIALLLQVRNVLTLILVVTASGYLALSQVVLVFNPDQVLLELWEPVEFDVAGILVVSRLAIVNGVLALLIALRSSYLLVKSFWPGTCSRKVRYSALSLSALLFAGYLSNFVSHRAAEEVVAAWLNAEVIKREAFFTEPDEVWAESLERFRSVGARATPSNDPVSEANWATIGPTYFLAPFVASVGYGCEIRRKGKPDTAAYSDCLVLCVFGKVAILNTDSDAAGFAFRWLKPI